MSNRPQIPATAAAGLPLAFGFLIGTPLGASLHDKAAPEPSSWTAKPAVAPTGSHVVCNSPCYGQRTTSPASIPLCERLHVPGGQ